MTYAIDTNTVSYFIQDNTTVISKLREILMFGNSIIIPPVTYYEILRGFKHKPAPRKERAFSRMCLMFPIGQMNIRAWECAADIYAHNRKIGKPAGDNDILIAAFCIVNNYTLVTHNTKHFVDIQNLRMEDWTV